MKSFFRSFFFFTVSLFLSIANAQEQRMQLLGNLNIPHGVSGGTTYFSSCWGWVSPDGREYALLGTCNGTSIIDLNSDSLREIQFIPGVFASYCLREIKTYKQYAYIVTEGGGGTQIVDLSCLPDTAILVKNFIYRDSSNSTTKHTTYSHTVTISDGYLYLNGSRGWKPTGGSVIFSLRNDPTNPEFLFALSTNYFHDTYVRNDTMYASSTTSGGGGGLFIVDVKNKTSPTGLGKISYTGSGTHNSWLSLDGKYVFTADEIGTTQHNMKVWDISNFPEYQQVTSWHGEPTSIVHNVHGRGNYIYVAHYKAGMYVVDVHDPIYPFTVDFYDSYNPVNDGIASPFAGCWGVYPYFPSGRWIGSDMQTGLYLFSFDSLKPRERVQLLLPENNSITAPLQFLWSSAASQHDDPHLYDLYVSSDVADTIITTNDTSFTFTSFPKLRDGQPFEWFVVVRDEFTEVSSTDTFHFTHIDPLGISANEEQTSKFELKQNYPNPFNPITKIAFELPATSEVSLKIYNSLGEEVLNLLDAELLSSGNQEVYFNASGLPSGTYYYRLTTPQFAETKVMILIR
ncbi:MAG: choice-of-anchor B family protein [Ignavibacteriae bacterium]|nr:choice-of-anchor B family protein [Ignavibacteriota bacterium]